MAKSLTTLLALVIVVTLLTTAIAYLRLDAARSAAVASERDYQICRDDLRDLDAWHVTGGATGNSTGQDLELNRRVRRAATVATLGKEQLVSIEPGPSVRVRDTDMLRTPVYLRLDDVTLRQVVAFVHELTAGDESVRATGIELSTPQGPAAARAGGGEPWTADVTVSQSSINPEKK